MVSLEPASNLAKKYSIESITETVEDKFNALLFDASSNKNVLVSFPLMALMRIVALMRAIL